MKARFESFMKIFDEKFVQIVFAVIILFPILILLVYFLGVRKAPVREDAVGYYAYLPAVFIYKDLNFDFLIDEDVPYTKGENSFERVFNPDEAEVMGFNEVEERRYIDKYPIGVALLLIPFFLVGHVLSVVFGEARDGWSFFYQYMALWGGIVYFSLGIIFLKKTLREYFSSKITLFTLLAVTLGTNLFNYAVYENIYSHVYSFFLISLFLFLVPKWLVKMSIWNSVLLSITFGLLVLVRFTNAIVIIFPILYGITSFGDFSKRVKKLIRNWKMISLCILIFIVLFLPQVLYWKYATGEWIVFSYQGEGFNFLNPQLFNVLLSTQKGLFFWSPILLFSLVGFFLLKGGARKYLIPSVLVLTLQVYIVSSWWNWRYGWSYGHRAFVDFLPVFAIGLAGFYTALKAKWAKIFVFGLSIILICLSTFQMFQYWLRILPPEHTTFEDYQKIFLKLDKDLRYFWSYKY